MAEAFSPAIVLDRFQQHGGKAVTTCPWCDKMGRELGTVALCLVVTWRRLELGRSGDRAVQAADPELTFGHKQNAFPIALHLVARLGLQPAKTVAINNGRVRGIAQIVKIETVEFGDVVDGNCGFKSRSGLFHGRYMDPWRCCRNPVCHEFETTNP
jgi:hypothetical protein